MGRLLDASPIAVDSRGEQETISSLVFLIDNDLIETGVKLYAGDLAWSTEDESYGVELKSTPDLLRSLWSKQDGERLEWQLGRLREAVDVAILGHHGLLVGQGADLEVTKELKWGKGGWYAHSVKKTGYRKESVDGFLWGIQRPSTGKGVYVIERATREDLLRAVVEVYWWSRKEDHGTFHRMDGRRRAVSNDGGGVSADSLRVLAAFPGVGEDRARRLLEFFGSLGAVLTATEEERTRVVGIGKGVSRRIEEVVQGGYKAGNGGGSG